MPPGLELRDLTKSYDGFRAVDRLSLAVASGSVFGLLGPNGAGKTTTLRMILNIVAPDAGQVLLHGHPLRPEDGARIGYLPEERGLYKRMSVFDHLVFLGELRGLGRREARRRVGPWLERLDLARRARSRVEELSKGMQQKVQLAAALLHEPELLILDEPFTGLDPLNQSLFMDLLLEYRRDGRTILFSTHVLEQAEKLCDDIGLIRDGQSILIGALEDLKRRFASRRYRLVAQGDVARLDAVDAVERWRKTDDAVELVLRPQVPGPALLRELVDFLEVVEFRPQEATLEEIFVDAVRDAG